MYFGPIHSPLHLTSVPAPPNKTKFTRKKGENKT